MTGSLYRWHLALSVLALVLGLSCATRADAVMQTATQQAIAGKKCVAEPTGQAQLYLRGSMNNWATPDEYAFHYSCDAYYLNVKLQGRQEFKIGDDSWTPTATYGGVGGVATVPRDHAVVLGIGTAPGGASNLVFDFSGEQTLRLSFPGGHPTLVIGVKSFEDQVRAPIVDPVALGLSHDSRDLADRSPFGAVAAGTRIEFGLNAAASVEQATLVVESRRLEGNQDVLEYHSAVRIPMTAAAASGTTGMHGSPDAMHFRAAHEFDTAGVYGYYFEVNIAGRKYIYENNADPIYWTREQGSNGRGVVVEAPSTPHGIRRYRLTVFQSDYVVPAWASDAVFYYIFPERFRNGDPGNDPKPGVDKYHDLGVELHADWNEPPYRPGSGDGSDAVFNNDFFGGDIAGIIARLDYIAALGANTLYITPLFSASSNHKYDTADYENIDAHFGSNADFSRLTAAAAKRGLRVIPDASLNHTGSDSIYFDRYGKYGGQGAFAGGRINPASPYADWYRFDSTQSAPEKQYTGWVGVVDLPELNKTSPSFRQFAYGAGDSIMKRWLDRGAAGWRMDVAPWVPDDFWREWRTAIKQHKPDALTVAETWFDASKFFLGDSFDSTMNYIFRNAVLDYANGGDARQIYLNLEYLREVYPPQSLHASMNLLSGHDVPRSLHVLGYDKAAAPQAAVAVAKQRLLLAVLFQMIYPGAPAIYYGDEVGVTGGPDPYNRATYPWPDRGGKPDLALLAEFKRLIAMRKANPVLSHGSLSAPLYVDAHVIALARQQGDSWAITATNNSEASITVSVPLPSAIASASFDDALGGETMKPSGSTLTISIPARFGRVLIKR